MLSPLSLLWQNGSAFSHWFPMSNPVPLHSEAFSREVAKRLGQLMSERGTPAHQQVSLLTQLCGLSPSQARRKLQGAHWSFAEVLAVARHCEMPIDALFPGVSGASSGNSDLIAELPTSSWLEVDVRLGEFQGRGEARLGIRVDGPVDSCVLVAVQAGGGWQVGTVGDLGGNRHSDQRFLVDELLIHAPQSQLKRIAILDDDASLAISLAEWFNEAGFAASAFTSGQQLLIQGIGQFDGFIVDYLLAGESSQNIIGAINQQLPAAPVLLLTGKLRDATISEGELMAVLRSRRVTFFEKPVRPGVLAAALLNHFDQQVRTTP